MKEIKQPHVSPGGDGSQGNDTHNGECLPVEKTARKWPSLKRLPLTSCLSPGSTENASGEQTQHHSAPLALTSLSSSLPATRCSRDDMSLEVNGIPDEFFLATPGELGMASHRHLLGVVSGDGEGQLSSRSYEVHSRWIPDNADAAVAENSYRFVEGIANASTRNVSQDTSSEPVRRPDTVQAIEGFGFSGPSGIFVPEGGEQDDRQDENDEEDEEMNAIFSGMFEAPRPSSSGFRLRPRRRLSNSAALDMGDFIMGQPKEGSIPRR